MKYSAQVDTPFNVHPKEFYVWLYANYVMVIGRIPVEEGKKAGMVGCVKNFKFLTLYHFFWLTKGHSHILLSVL